MTNRETTDDDRGGGRLHAECSIAVLLLPVADCGMKIGTYPRVYCTDVDYSIATLLLTAADCH